ncbi:VOC family protein [Haloarcula sp. 1CSR25-25]|uniref:VOC family protein n=1 Tax=Haloarcula sp. 1CSR25-25 TaxID=2862545 RepID=UPI0028954693|nr:VOC family protein [Haloarcula sp. 1CSR25-25]MDT3433341.1 VOC family protein [Haloarcula sp. 1CSR25-25]
MTEKGGVDCAHLRVPDIERATRFYTETLGFAERSRETGVSRLATPPQQGGRCPLTLSEGQRGLDRLGIGVSEGGIRDIESRLAGRGTDFTRRTDTEGWTLRVTLPGGLPIELYSRDVGQTREDASVPSTETTRAPHGIDHVTVTAADVQADAEFLRDELGFRLSDVAMAGPGVWGRAFAHRGDGTHDVALVMEPLAPSMRLHHVAWRTADVDHVTRLIERVRAAGSEVDVDVRTGMRGARAAVYVRDPAGNRVELTTAATSQTPAAPIALSRADAEDIDTLWPETHPRRTG